MAPPQSFSSGQEFTGLQQPGFTRKSSYLGFALTALGLTVALALAIGVATGALGLESAQFFAIILAVLLIPVVFLDPVHGLMVYAVVAPVSPDIDVFGLPIRVQDPLVGVILIGAIFQALRHGNPGPPVRLRNMLFAYCAFAVFATAFAFMHSPLTREPNWAYVFKLIQFAVLALVAGYSIRSPQHILMIMGAIVAGLVLQFTRLEVPSAYGAVRLHGIGIDEQANVLSCFAVISVCAVLGIMDRTKSIGLGAVLMLILIGGCFVALETKSRTGYGSLGVVMFVGLLTMRRRAIPLTMMAAGFIALLIRPDYLMRALSAGAVVGLTEDSSYTDRLNAYGTVWDRISHGELSILFGGGRGTYSLAFADTQWGIELFYGGILGLLLFIGLVIAVLYRAIWLFRRCRGREDAMGMASVAGLLAAFAAAASCFGLTSWSAIRCGEVIFLTIGLIIGATRIAEAEREAGVPRGGSVFDPRRARTYLPVARGFTS